MTPDSLKKRRLAGVFLFGWIFFNYPVFSLFNLPVTWRGIPLLYGWAFFLWALIIVLIMLASRRTSSPGEPAPRDAC